METFHANGTYAGAQLLVENNVFTGVDKPLYATDEGFAVATGNDFGGGSNTAPVYVYLPFAPVTPSRSNFSISYSGTFTSPPYSYSLLATSSVKSSVTANAGQLLSF